MAAQVKELRERVAEMERAASRNSGNSSMPPASDDLPDAGSRGSSGGCGAAEQKRNRGKQPAARGRRCGGRCRTGPRTTTRGGRAGAGVTCRRLLTWAWPAHTSRRKSGRPRRSGSSMTCTNRGAPAAGARGGAAARRAGRPAVDRAAAARASRVPGGVPARAGRAVPGPDRRRHRRGRLHRVRPLLPEDRRGPGRRRGAADPHPDHRSARGRVR